MSANKVLIICLLLLLPAAALAGTHPIQPVIGNIDSSTIADEIITTSFDGSLYAWRADRTILSGNWPVKFNGFVCAKPALVNLDSNPKDLEILVPVCDLSGKSYLYGLQGSGNVIPGWIKELQFQEYSGPIVGQFKIDGKKTGIVFIGSHDGLVHAFYLEDWKEVSGWPRDLGGGQAVSVAIVDIDMDKANEIITTSGGGRIAVTKQESGEWKTVADFGIQAGFACPAVIADLNKDGINELIVGASNGTVHVWSYKGGKAEPLWSIPTGQSIITSPMAGDFDGDKELEILCFGSDGKANIINSKGSIVQNRILGHLESSSPEKRIAAFKGNLGNYIFFSQSGSYVSNVYHEDPGLSITEWGIYHHLRQPYVIDLSANPDPFSPNDDGRNDSTRITYRVESQGSCEGSLAIYDPEGLTVKMIKNGNMQGDQAVVWDGRGDDKYNDGRPVSSGSYDILLQFESPMSDKISQLNTVAVDTVPPFFKTFNVSPEEVGPNKKSDFTFSPSEPSRLSISIVDTTGKSYKSYSEFLEPSEDPNEIFVFEWDGKGDHNEIFSADYTYIATLEDLAGNVSAPKTGVISVGIDAPFVNGVYADPQVFSTVSEINKTTLHYAIPKEAKVWVSVYNSQGGLIKTLLNAQSQSQGAKSIDWNGSDDHGRFLKDGQYSFRVEAAGLKGTVSATVENTVEIDNTPPSILQANVFPSEFSPKVFAPISTLSFFVSEKSDLAIEVLDRTNSIVKSVSSRESAPSGSYSYNWDGTDDTEKPVSDGNYKFRINARDGAGNISVKDIPVVANSLPPKILNASANPNLFTPASGRSNSWSKIAYTLSGGAGKISVDVNILDASRGTVKRIINNETTIPGNYSEFWYGDVDFRGGVGDANGDGLADGGEYIYEIVATDSMGNRARAEGTVSIAQNPAVSAYMEPTIFSPAKGGSTTIHYNVDYSNLLFGNAQAWIDVYDQSDNKVYEFSDSVSQGDYTHLWNGTNNQAGGTVPDGIYMVKVRIQDPEGNNMIAYSNRVVVDSNGPVITLTGANPNPFVPNILESTSFDFSISDPTTQYYCDGIKIYDSSNHLVKTLAPGQAQWDGRVDGAASDLNRDSIADEGIYTFMIHATDEAGNESLAQGQVYINKAVLRLTEVSNPVSPSHFSYAVVPSTAITYTLSKTSVGPAMSSASKIKALNLAPQAVRPVGCVSVEIRALDNTLIRALVPSSGDDGKRDAGVYQTGWDGKDNNGMNVQDGKYKVFITAHDPVGNPAESQAELIYDLVVDTTPPTGSLIINNGRRYTNSRDVSLTLKADDPLSDVKSMKVWEDGVHNIDSEEDLANTRSWAIPQGNDGEKIIYVRFKDEAGNWNTTPISGSIVLDTKPPAISSISASPDPFSPGASPGVKDSTAVSYSLDEQAKITIFRDNGTKIVANIDSTIGSNSIAWSPGNSVSEEIYHYIILATDEAGNSSQTTGSDTVSVDNTPPKLSIRSVGPKPFNQLWQTFVATVEVFDACPSLYVDAQVLNNDGSLLKQIRSVADGLVPTREISSFTWDGKDEDGFYMNEGKYRIRIKASDPAGNETDWNAISIEAVDDQRLTNTGVDSFSPNLILDAGSYKLDWAEGYVDRPASTQSYVTATLGFGNLGNAIYEHEEPFLIGFEQTVSLHLEGSVYSNGTVVDFIIKDATGRAVFSQSFTTPYTYWDYPINNTSSILLSPGTYTLYVVITSNIFKNDTYWARFTAGYLDRKANLYTKRSTGAYPFNWAQSGPVDVENLKNGPTLLPEDVFTEHLYSDDHNGKYHDGSYVHRASVNNGDVYYQRGQVSGHIYNEYGDNSCAHIKVSGTNWKSWDKTTAFTISYDQTIYVESHGDGWGGWNSEHWLKDANGVQIWHAPAPGHGQTIFLRAGTYCLITEASASGGGVDVGTRAYYYYKTVVSTVEWSSPVRITNYFVRSGNPSICTDDHNNAYVAWEYGRDGNRKIYFQKIPLEFQPLKGFKPTIGISSFSTNSTVSPYIIYAQSLYLTPECLSPKGATVQTLRPEFRWYGLRGVMDYRIECAKASDEASLANTMDYFNANISFDQAQADRPLGVFTIPDHQTGLDENGSAFNSEPFWYWRVEAISSEGVTTSEAAPFAIHLPVEISGVVNYPNPFNPDLGNTKIRYKLGREADEVTIRIYDITGALVKELEGTTNGEGAGMMDKYNDVAWDGRNGRGDVVRNGVYPFEVVVSSGGKRVSARGKIVVLK